MPRPEHIAQHQAGAFAPTVLREYAPLAYGERGSLVGPHSEVAWMCAPHWDSDAVFASLIGGMKPQQARHAMTPR